MRRKTPDIYIIFIILMVFSLAGCNSSSPIGTNGRELNPVYSATINIPCRAPESALRMVSYNDRFSLIPIESRGRAQASELIDFFTATNSQISSDYLYRIAHLYIDEATAEGINSDIAFCQMVHETNYLRFDGDVQAWQNNFAGLGAVGGGEGGLVFDSVETGIRAHIQHLKAYTNNRPLCNSKVDPRFAKVRRGRSPYVYGLAGTWATDSQYGVKLKRKLRELEEFL